MADRFQFYHPQNCSHPSVVGFPSNIRACPLRASSSIEPNNQVLTPSDSTLARQLHNDAVALTRIGRNREACDRLRDAVRTAGVTEVDPRTLKALWQIARAEGDWPSALAAGIRGAIRDPLDFPFIDKVVRSLHECPLPALVPDSMYPMRPLPVNLPALSVIIVSRDDVRYAGVDAQFEAAFSRWPHERIRIADATSMYDGYARGYARAHVPHLRPHL